MANPLPRRKPTIHDVAALAGVAPSTVSRALSRPERVSVATRERVEQAAADINYLPSPHASRLRSGRSGTVALLVPDIANPFYFDIIRGTQRQLKAAGYLQLLVDTEESQEVEAAAIANLVKTVDGIVLTASRLSDEQLTEAIQDIPIITVNRDVQGVPAAIIDTATGAGQAVEHLVSMGHHMIAYISGPVDSWSDSQRWAAIQKASERHGVSLTRLGPFSPKTTSGAAAADAAINSEVTASIAFNDLIAIGMLRRLRARGVTVPQEMSIVGCDDIFGADFCDPALTTITAPLEEVGRAAISMLLGRIGRPPTIEARRKSVLSSHLTVRESTGPSPG